MLRTCDWEVWSQGTFRPFSTLCRRVWSATWLSFLQSQYDRFRKSFHILLEWSFQTQDHLGTSAPQTLSRHLDPYLLLVCGSQVVEAGSIWSKPIRPGDVAIVAGSCADLKTLKKEAISWLGFMIFSEKWWVFPRCLLLTWPLGLHTFPDCQNSCPELCLSFQSPVPSRRFLPGSMNQNANDQLLLLRENTERRVSTLCRAPLRVAFCEAFFIHSRMLGSCWMFLVYKVAPPQTALKGWSCSGALWTWAPLVFGCGYHAS